MWEPLNSTKQKIWHEGNIKKSWSYSWMIWFILWYIFGRIGSPPIPPTKESLPLILGYCGQTVSCCVLHAVPSNRLPSIWWCCVVPFGGYSSLQFADVTGPLRYFLCICKIHLIRFIIYRLLYSVRILWNIVSIYKQEFQLHCIQYSNTIIFKELK